MDADVLALFRQGGSAYYKFDDPGWLADTDGICIAGVEYSAECAWPPRGVCAASAACAEPGGKTLYRAGTTTAATDPA